MSQSASNLIWIDLEMTGLDTQTDHIIEVATIITDSQLSILEEGPVIAVNVDEVHIEAMDEWNTSHHSESGLVDRVRKSPYSVSDAEKITLDFIKQYVPQNSSPMCGNSICQDRRFLARLMPDLESYFHYRNLDVSSFKILVSQWAGDQPQYEKQSSHIALEDVRDSIEELKFYRQHYFKF